MPRPPAETAAPSRALIGAAALAATAAFAAIGALAIGALAIGRLSWARAPSGVCASGGWRWMN